MTEDPERLVAEALRAHAARTPLPEPAEGTGSTLGGYGLLSGSDVVLPNPGSDPGSEPEPATLRDPTAAEETRRLESGRSVAVGWIVLLALLLGLASGAVVGLVTLL